MMGVWCVCHGILIIPSFTNLYIYVFTCRHQNTFISSGKKKKLTFRAVVLKVRTVKPKLICTMRRAAVAMCENEGRAGAWVG